MTDQPTMKVEAGNGRVRAVPVFPEELTTWTEGDVLMLSDGRRLRLTGELYIGGPVHGDALIERVIIRNGHARADYSIARWLKD